MSTRIEREELVQRINQLTIDLKYATDRLHTKLTIKQWHVFSSIRWNGASTEASVIKVSKSKKLRRLAITIDVTQEKLRDCRKEMNAILDAIEVKHAMLMKSNLSLVHSKPADWYELTLRKIGKAQRTASKRENKADLRLVG